jgi:hypothetical protein
MQTCKKIYREAKRVLYTTNTIDVRHPQTLIFLARTIPSQHLASIAHLQVSWKGRYTPYQFRDWNPTNTEEMDQRVYPDNLATWERCWEIVARDMPGLQSLKLRFDVEKFQNGMERAEAVRMLQPVQNVRVKDFGFEVHGEKAEWDVGEVEKWLRDIVCQ